MTTQPNFGGMPPAAAAGTDRDDSDMIDRTTEDDGTPVGAADAAEDARQAGADRDVPLRDTIEEGATDGGDSASPTDDGVPVGEADADADRQAAGAD